MYRINELAKHAGITTRTLRYYDKIGLLHPHKIDENGYRYYSTNEVDILQQILFFKELEYSLEEIKKILTNKDYSIDDSLHSHLESLSRKRDKIDSLIDLVIDTLDARERRNKMSIDKKFEAFKDKAIKDNMEQYGEELEQSYGKDFIEQSNKLYKSKSKYQMKQQDELTKKLNDTIKQAINTSKTSELAVKMCELHKEWIQFYWPSYSKEAHLGLCKMYVEDERFKAYYEKIAPNAAEFLYEAMKAYLK